MQEPLYSANRRIIDRNYWIIPAAEMEDTFFPQVEWVVDAVHERLLPLPGHQVSSDQSLLQFVVALDDQCGYWIHRIPSRVDGRKPAFIAVVTNQQDSVGQ